MSHVLTFVRRNEARCPDSCSVKSLSQTDILLVKKNGF